MAKGLEGSEGMRNGFGGFRPSELRQRSNFVVRSGV
jgi:hypothetical protein